MLRMCLSEPLVPMDRRLALQMAVFTAVHLLGTLSHTVVPKEPALCDMHAVLRS